MFRVHDRSFKIKSAGFAALVDYDPDDDTLDIAWSLDVRCHAIQVEEEIWHPHLQLEEATLEIDDPVELEHAETAIDVGAYGDDRCTFFLGAKVDAWNFRAVFGERRGDVFDVLIAGTAWDLSRDCETALRIMTPIVFDGMTVRADTIEAAHIAVERFSGREAFVAERVKGGFCFR